MKILHIDCSPRPESHSRQLSAAIVKKLLEGAPAARISRRDLGSCPLSHVSPDYATALSSPATLAAPPRSALDLSEALIREVESADVIVIGAPMHNLTVPSVLKAWIDQILRAGRTFLSSPAGKRDCSGIVRCLSESLPVESLLATKLTSPIFSRRIYRLYWAASG
ncbi:NAD(P)H-dependent oxidoreductase [Bradyrhizobium sp. CW4]|uniref:FMN-dependent NADH-azoreductase n=1 Tax=Bradyrhizobium sp. CW4 TaxID=2782687 RepID=UPI001FFAA53E